MPKRAKEELEDIEDYEAEPEVPSKQTQPDSEDMFPTLPALPIPSRITPLSKKNDVIRQDAEMYHSMFTALAYQWSQVTTVKEVIDLSLATSKLIMERRRALLLPYAAAPTEESDDRYVLPID